MRQPEQVPAREAPPLPAPPLPAPPLPAPAPARLAPALGLTPATVLALQRTAGNAAVSSLMRNHASAPKPAPAAEEVRVVERMPTLPEPGVKYVIGKPERAYTFDAWLEGAFVHYQNLTAAQTLAKLRQIWVILHGDIDQGRDLNLKMQKERDEHYVVGFWSDVRGRTYMPEPAMWDRVGRGSLYEALKILDSTDAALKERWDLDEAEAERRRPPELQTTEHRWAEEGFDATEERIRRAGSLLEKAGHELDECKRRLAAYNHDTAAGAALMVRDIKITIVALSTVAGGAGAGFAPAGAGILTQAGYGAATMGMLGVVQEAGGQAGEIYYGLRDHFDVAAIGKRATRDVVIGFVGGVIGGKFSQVLKGRLGGWLEGLSGAEIAASGLTPEQLLSNSERLFLEWVGGSLMASPFTTTASELLDSALGGKLTVQTWGDFASAVLDKLIVDGTIGAFLTYTGTAGAKHGRVEPAPAAEPRRGSAGHPTPPERGNPEYVRRPPGRRPSTGHPKPPRAPVIEESPPGGFEPTTKEPAPEDYGPAPHQEEIVLDRTTPERETRTNSDRGTRKHYKNTAELRKGIRKALRELRKKAAAAEKSGEPREIDILLKRIKQHNPAFAERVRRYYAALENPRWVEEQMVHLWEQARDHGRTPAAELEHIIGDGKGVNEFKNDFSLKDPAEIAEDFRQRVMLDPRVFVDVQTPGDNHGSHTHAFQQYLGDRLFGPGEGLKFRLDLAAIEGTGMTVRPGQEDAYDEPLWASTWDALFDADGAGNMHAPEEFGPVLQDELDFPRWNPTAKP